MKAMEKLNDLENLNHMHDGELPANREQLMSLDEIEGASKEFIRLRRKVKYLDNDAFSRAFGIEAIKSIMDKAGINFEEEAGSESFSRNVRTMVRRCTLAPFLARLLRRAIGDERNAVYKRIKNAALSKT